MWTALLIYASTHQGGIVGLLPGSSLPFSLHNGLAVNKVTTCAPPTFSVQETLEAQAWIHAAQHPADCSAAHVGLSEYSVSGMGSSIFGALNSFLLALARGHVWIPVGSWNWGRCPLGSLECYFLPVSNCSPPDGGMASIDGVRVHSASSINKPLTNRVVAVPPQWQHKGFLWWRAQVAAYMLRPNNATSAALTAAAQSIFGSQLQRPFASVYIRHGDKAREGPVFCGKTYLDMLKMPSAELQLKAVFMSSDTQAVLEEAMELFSFAGHATLLFRETEVPQPTHPCQ
jgi:hypothetical protein